MILEVVSFLGQKEIDKLNTKGSNSNVCGG